mmetsp:Transcript_12244/g.31887  ORF Transcript_12244/g.31887 Transcript_12244/m.31887 type:complete len:120 (-) Transcript_12244:38-397(-)
MCGLGVPRGLLSLSHPLCGICGEVHARLCHGLSGMLSRLAVSVGCVGVLEELVDNQQCVLTVDFNVCAAAAGREHLGAMIWLHSRSCYWNGFSSCTQADRQQALRRSISEAATVASTTP